MQVNVGTRLASSAQGREAAAGDEVLGSPMFKDSSTEKGRGVHHGQSQRDVPAGMVTNLRDLPGEHPAAWLNREPLAGSDSHITAESCFRPLSSMPFIIGVRGSLADRDNNMIAHEQIFFSDGTDIGYGSSGIMVSEDKSKYSMCEPLEATKEQIMERVNRLADQFEADDYRLLKHNCQDFVDIVGR